MLIEFLISALIERFADLFHKLVIEIKIMKHGKAHTEAFLCLEKMSDIRTAVKTASGTLTVGIDRSVVLCESLVKKVDLTLPGNDPVEIVKDWVTVVEDGYLTLRFRTASGNNGRIHYVNLVAGQNPDNPYEVEFCHDAQGDVTGDMFDGLVAFKLDCLPDTEGKTVKLLLKWNSFSGPKQVELDYCTRRDSHNPTTAIVDQLPTLKLK